MTQVPDNEKHIKQAHLRFVLPKLSEVSMYFGGFLSFFFLPFSSLSLSLSALLCSALLCSALSPVLSGADHPMRDSRGRH